MTDNDKTNPAEGASPEAAKTEHQPDGGQADLSLAEPSTVHAEDAGDYRLREEVSSSGKKATETADWYYTASGQKREGPVSLGDLQRLVAAGRLGRDDQVWRSGLPEWTAVASVPELFHEPAPPPPPRPKPAPQPPAADTLAALQTIERNLTSPAVLRGTGWVCGAMGALLLLLSVPLAFVWRSWFTGGWLFLFAFLVLHALARIVEALDR
jgi:hypothetical protein